MKIHIGEKSYCVSWTYYYYYYYFIIRRRTILNWVNGNLTTKLDNDKKPNINLAHGSCDSELNK